MFEDNVQRIVKLMKETFAGGPFKEIYDGDPEQIPVFNLPCLVVDITGDTTERGAMSQDDVTEQIVIKVIFNKKDDWSNKVDPNNLTTRKIREIVAARDPETGLYGDQTIKGAIRRLSTKGLTAVGEDVTVEYGIVPRVDKQNPIITAEGHVTVPITYTVDVTEEP